MSNATLRNWKAKRAGGKITITGVNQDDRPEKVVGVDTIEAGNPPVATDKSGKRYLLL